jgi:tetratricopeptide (TPR) repeat protein
VYLCLKRRFQITLLATCLVSITGPGQGVAGMRQDPPPDDGATAADIDRGLSQPFLLDDTLEPFVPRRPRSEADEEQAEALTLFSAARMLQWKGEEAKALRLYQRALWYDPKAGVVAESMVSLALDLNRPAEAARYALRADRLEGIDPLHLRQLGVYLSMHGDWQGAVELYEKALLLRKEAPTSAADVLLHMEMGRLRHLLDDYKNAAEDFALVIDALENPKKYRLSKKVVAVLLDAPGPTYGLMAECFLLAGRVDEAAGAFEKSHKASPDKARQGFDLARVQDRRDQPAEALEEIQAYFDEHGNTAGIAPYRLLETILENLGKPDELLGRLEELHAADQENVPLAYFLAQLYSKAQQFDKAEPLLVGLAKDSPTITGYRYLANILRKSDRTDDLLDLLAEASTRVPTLDSLSEEDESLSQDADLMEALTSAARKRYQASPDDLSYNHRQAMALLSLDAHRFDAAGEFFDLAIEADSSQAANLLPVWGMALLIDDRFAEAAKVFQRGIELNLPENEAAMLQFYLASALEMDGRTDEALAAAKKAAQTDDNSPRLASRVGWVLYHAERLDEAHEVYSKVVERFDSKHDSPEIRDAVRDARLILSNICVLREQLPEAVEWLQQVLDEFPGNIAALNDLGYLWADRGEHVQRAHDMIREALDADPENAAYRDSLGWVLYRLGRLDEAAAELEKASEGEPDPVILDHLGDVYSDLKKPDKAKAAWQRSVERFKEQEDDKGAEKVQKKIAGSP